MFLSEVDRKIWEAYEHARELFDRHPGRYRVKLISLLLQAVVVLGLVVGIIVLLLYWALRKPLSSDSFRILIFLGINVIWPIVGYIIIIYQRPWRGMLLLDRKNYPTLYRRVNWIARVLKAPPIHRIYVSTEFNAAVGAEFVFIPGLQRNVLMLGYPLLCATSSRALLGCLAHEFGHLAGNHLSWRGIFYRITIFWQTFQLGIFTWIFHFWRVRFLQSLEYTLHPLYYQHEIDADRNIIARLGADYAAECLLQLELKGRIFCEDRSFLVRIVTTGESVVDYAGGIRELLHKPLTGEEYDRLISKVTSAMPPIFDEHPGMRYRLALTGVTDWAPYAMRQPDALEKLLGNAPDFFAKVNNLYAADVGAALAEFRDEYQRDLKLIENYDPAFNYSQEECIKLIGALSNLGRQAERNALLTNSCRRFPAALDLQCMRLVDELNASTSDAVKATLIDQLERFIRQSPMLIYLVNDELLSYYLEHGESEKIKDFFDLRDCLAVQNTNRIVAALSPDDNLIPLDLTESKKAKIITVFSRIKMVRRLYAVTRRYDDLVVGTDFLVIEQRRFHLCDPNEELQDLQEQFPEYTVVIVANKLFLQHLVAMPGSCIWDRSGKSYNTIPEIIATASDQE